MTRKTYISCDDIKLSEYIDDIDDPLQYACWLDPVTEEGFNYKSDLSFESFQKEVTRSRFHASILRTSDDAVIGYVFMSPEEKIPDLAIMIYKPYRHQGYGKQAVKLALQYGFDTLGLDIIHAGCYEHHTISKHLLTTLGFHLNEKGCIEETHYLTGEKIIQLDYVIHK